MNSKSPIINSTNTFDRDKYIYDGIKRFVFFLKRNNITTSSFLIIV